MARPARLELATPCLEGRCSIQLSYGRISIHSRTFMACTAILLRPSTIRAKGRRSAESRYAHTSPPNSKQYRLRHCQRFLLLILSSHFSKFSFKYLSYSGQ